MLPEKLTLTSRHQTPQAKVWQKALDEKDYLALKPWRKGPYHLGTLTIDSEWDCDIKWQRLLPILPSLKNKTILDIGCNSGYFMFRMAEHHPKKVIGIDPAALYYYQFHAIQNVYQKPNLEFYPIGFEDIPLLKTQFDRIFCMGILYHHPDPIAILNQCLSVLNPEGILILETLILNKPGNHILRPKKTYAKMKNVYEIPTLSVLTRWLETAGYTNIICHDVTPTTSKEQRVTAWSSAQSLMHFLDPENPQKTCEGYPSPMRTIVSARKP